MPITTEPVSPKTQLLNLSEALESGTLLQVKRILNTTLPAVDIAHFIESSPPKQRNIIWELIDSENEGEILQYLPDEIRSDFLSQMSAERLASVTSDLDVDDVADILQQLPEAIIQEVLLSMSSHDRQRLESVLSYPEDSAGGLMNPDVVTIRPDITIDVVLRYLRRHKALPETTNCLFVVNGLGQLAGLLTVTKMLVADPGQTVEEVMEANAISIDADQPSSEVAQIFSRHDLISAPVINENGILLGQITIDDVVDVIREEADHSLLSMAGLDDDEDTFAPTLKTSRRRAVWLGINLITAFAASFVIGFFEQALDKVVALAILMPIVASMGGIAGSQVLTLVIRGMALGHVDQKNVRWLIKRELIVCAINGVLWATVIAAITYFWFHDPLLAAIIASAILINLMIAALSGVILPITLKGLGIDPALAGSVLLTTITDIAGFLSFLGLASALYLN